MGLPATPQQWYIWGSCFWKLSYRCGLPDQLNSAFKHTIMLQFGFQQAELNGALLFQWSVLQYRTQNTMFPSPHPPAKFQPSASSVSSGALRLLALSKQRIVLTRAFSKAAWIGSGAIWLLRFLAMAALTTLRPVKLNKQPILWALISMDPTWIQMRYSNGG